LVRGDGRQRRILTLGGLFQLLNEFVLAAAEAKNLFRWRSLPAEALAEDGAPSYHRAT
jgi:hypothetical protein